MQSFFKKRSADGELFSTPAKKPRLDSENVNQDNLRKSPRSIVAWNCNGLTGRLKSEEQASQIKDFVVKHAPDIMFFSEVRIAAANNATGKPGPHTTWYRSKMKEADKKSTADAILVRSFFDSPEFASYKVYFSLADIKYAGTAMLLNTATTQLPKSVRYNLEQVGKKGSIHDPDGRVIVAKFGDFSILHTYVPNNGWETGHFRRRKEWDGKVHSFMKRKKEANVRIIWVGDLNVAPLDADLSHPAYYRKQTGGRYADKTSIVVDPEYVGQPGCTDAERKRFEFICDVGELVDVYREMVGYKHHTTFSWRGHTTGKHAGRGMRIDHCLLSRTLVSSVKSVDINDHGKERHGFLGSDHCPLILKLDNTQTVEDDATDKRDDNSGKSD